MLFAIQNASSFKLIKQDFKAKFFIRFFLVMLSMYSSFTSAIEWDMSNEASTKTINHTLWQDVLDQYLISNTASGVNLFKYKSVTASDKTKLGNYISMLEKLNPSVYKRTEQKAYWINLYNALTIKLILDNYPITSITKLGDSIFSFGPWDDELVHISGEDLSLNDIEHKILRPIFKDNRIHYAVNCASYGCPNLSAIAYTAKNTNALLDKGECDYVNHARGVTFKGDDLIVSSIYDWYIEDFGDSTKTLVKHLLNCAQPKLKGKLLTFLKNDGDIDHDYDWSLNEPR